MIFLATIDLITKSTLQNIPFFEDLVLYITIHGRITGFNIVFVCCVFISTLVSDKCDIKHCGENQGEICFALTCFMHYMHIF
jgi:hypothetical protein